MGKVRVRESCGYFNVDLQTEKRKKEFQKTKIGPLFDFGFVIFRFLDSEPETWERLLFLPFLCFWFETTNEKQLVSRYFVLCFKRKSKLSKRTQSGYLPSISFPIWNEISRNEKRRLYSFFHFFQKTKKRDFGLIFRFLVHRQKTNKWLQKFVLHMWTVMRRPCQPIGQENLIMWRHR